MWKNMTCSSLSGRTKPFATLHMGKQHIVTRNERKSTPPTHCRSHYLSSMVNISAMPNSDTLDRVFKWHSSAAATCARCRKQHMACLMEARSPRNFAYMHRA